MVSAALASVLRSGRSEFNARFIAGRRIHPDLQADLFTDFLQTRVDDLVRAVDVVGPDRVSEVTMAAYDAALDLVGQKLVGPRSRLIEEGWRRILPNIAILVATASSSLIPAVCNAIHQLASTPDARPAQWIEIMEKLGPQCTDADTFLKLGQVSAWRAGLAHFRQGAIVAADSLPEVVALSALGAKADSTWSNLRAKLQVDPWFEPASAGQEALGMRVVTAVGSFRGFGGLFVEPPVVVPYGEHFLTRSNGDSWLLTADAFGATFHRAPLKEFETAAEHYRLPSGFKVSCSRVEFAGDHIEFPVLGGLSSVAANPTTLAVTSPLSHSIVLIALK